MWIKICGIPNIKTAADVAKFSPDALGLNFYPHTPRTVSVAVAAEIARNLPREIELVGLFVNESAPTIYKICQQSSLQTIQLHGDESPADLRDLATRDDGLRIIRAWHLGPEGLQPLGDYLTRLNDLGVQPVACLIDARVAGKQGGTGSTVNWSVLAKDYRRDEWPPMILAGGLHPGNVAEAIQTVRPWGVDVASGVESTPGQKDIALVEQFINAAREAFLS
jgi:phosphoribosylanthranilate isomerase